MMIPKWIRTLVMICAQGGWHVKWAKRGTTKSFKVHPSEVCQKWCNLQGTSSPAPTSAAATTYQMQLRQIHHPITDHKSKLQLKCKRENASFLGTSTESCSYLGFVFSLLLFWSIAIWIDENTGLSFAFIFVWGFFDIGFLLFNF